MHTVIVRRGLYKIAGLLLALLTISADVAAYSFFKCDGVTMRWPASLPYLDVPVPMYASPNSFPAGPWREALEKSFDRLNDEPSRFKLVFKGYGEASTLSGDGVNKTWGSSNKAYWGYYGYPGAHVPVKGNCSDVSENMPPFLKEADVIVNYMPEVIGGWTKYEFAVDIDQYSDEWGASYNGEGEILFLLGTGKLSFGAMLLHELGHASGLLHENRFYNVMGRTYSHLHVTGQYAYPYLGADAIAGLLKLYGNTSALPDLSVAHFKYDAPYYVDEEYSSHVKTQVFQTFGPNGGVAADPTYEYSHSEVDWPSPGYLTYQVEPGAFVRAEFTYENLGPHSLIDVPIRFYVSTDKVINFQDTSLGTAKLTLYGGGHGTARVKLQIPSWLTRDKNYWIGVHVDYSNSVNERNGNNNTSYLPIHTYKCSWGSC